MDKEEQRERGIEIEKKDREKKDRQTEHSPTCLTPVLFLLSTIVGIRSGSWRSFITTHADVWFVRFAHAHSHTLIRSPTFNS
jgi:hypothetical protein